MADEILENQTQNASTETQDTIPAEVREMMEISLNNGFKPEAAQTQETQTQAGETAQQQEQTQTAQEEEVLDADEYARGVGYASWEEMKADIPELRKLKEAPPKAEIKYENEVSEKLAKAWMAGKNDEVYSYLNEQRQLERLTTSEVNKDTADEIIKLGMQIRYKSEGLTEQEINYKFNKQYAIPKEPQLDVDDDESVEKHNAWKEQVADIEMSKIIDAKVAKRELEAQKTKLVLPQVEESVDEGYLQYKKQVEEGQSISLENIEAYKKYTPEVLETKMNFNDEANKIAFELQFKPDSESFAKVIDAICDNDKFAKMFEDQDGNFDRKKFAEVIYYGLNKDKFGMEAMKQAKNATMKQTLLADNTDRGMNRQLAQNDGEPSQLDKEMQRSLAGFI